MKIINPKNLKREELVELYKFYTDKVVQLAASSNIVDIEMAKLFDKASGKYAEAIENYEED